VFGVGIYIVIVIYTLYVAINISPTVKGRGGFSGLLAKAVI